MKLIRKRLYSGSNLIFSMFSRTRYDICVFKRLEIRIFDALYIFSDLEVPKTSKPDGVTFDISLSKIQKYITSHPYIIGHYNPAVRIIDLVSHTTSIVCVNFIHKWRDLRFKEYVTSVFLILQEKQKTL